MATITLTDKTKLYGTNTGLKSIPTKVKTLIGTITVAPGGYRAVSVGGFNLLDAMDVKYIQALINVNYSTNFTSGLEFYMTVGRSSLVITSDVIALPKPDTSANYLLKINFPFNSLICEADIDYAVNVYGTNLYNMTDNNDWGVVCDYPGYYYSTFSDSDIAKVNGKLDIIGYKL